ncbi:MAG: oligosaccharide flippase family protein, partial [Anaerolineae bacterium]|nr:oligosaccharide flippase family protein [Anaerolineae bacterium]
MTQSEAGTDFSSSVLDSQTDVQAKAAKGTAYTAIASIITLCVGFLRSVLLARLLTPDDYGVVTFALFFANFFGSLTPFSLRQAFIHSDPEDEGRIAGTMLTVDVGLALARFLIIALIAPWLTSFYPQYPQLPAVLRIFFAAYILGAATGAP